MFSCELCEIPKNISGRPFLVLRFFYFFFYFIYFFFKKSFHSSQFDSFRKTSLVQDLLKLKESRHIILLFLSGFLKCYRVTHIALFQVIGSLKKLFSIDLVNIYLFSIFFSITFANMYLFSIFFSTDFARWKSVGLPHFAYSMIREQLTSVKDTRISKYIHTSLTCFCVLIINSRNQINSFTSRHVHMRYIRCNLKFLLKHCGSRALDE